MDRSTDAARGPLHLILSTDATVSDMLRLGAAPWLRSMLTGYDRAFQVHFYSADRIDFSDRLGVRHHPLGPRARMPRRLRQTLYYGNLLRRAPEMTGLVRALASNLAILPEIKRRSGSRVIVDFHYDWAATSRAHYGGAKKWLARPIQNRCLRAADLVVASTRELRSMVERGHGARAIHIPNFVDGALFHPREPRARRIVYAGRLHWAKGCTVLIDAFVRIARKDQDATLEIMGSGEEEEALRARVPRALDGRIHFHGSRPQEEVAEALGGAAAFVLPTLTTEGNPKAVLEAMSCGTPPICSDVPGIRGLIDGERTGILVPPGDVEALAAALTRILDDEALRARISHACAARARRFGKERILRHQIRVMRICAGCSRMGVEPGGGGRGGAGRGGAAGGGGRGGAGGGTR